MEPSAVPQQTQSDAPVPSSNAESTEGDILIVIHDFPARSSDELTLTKGDHIRLVERDDEFGDGWFLGLNIRQNRTGLFPEVYTAPLKTVLNGSNGSSSNPLGNEAAPVAGALSAPGSLSGGGYEDQNRPTLSYSPIEATPPSEIGEAAPAPLNTTPPNASGSAYDPPTKPTLTARTSLPMHPRILASVDRSTSMSDSPVMNETLTSIDEHISDMSTPRHSVIERREIGDSGSEYSGPTHKPARSSYITGVETDEEDDHYSEAEVRKWTPRHVAEYLREMGVSPIHCQAFESQEITGDVLLGLDLEQLSMPEFRLGGTLGPRLQTWQKVQALQMEVLGISQEQGRASRLSMLGAPSDQLARSRSSATIKGTPRWSGAQSPRIGSGLARSTIHEGISSPPHTAPLTNTSTTSLAGASNSSRSIIIDGMPNRAQSSLERLQPTPLTTSTNRPTSADLASGPNLGRSHRKKPSLDQEWSMSGIPNAIRPPSAYKVIHDRESSHMHSLSLDTNGDMADRPVSSYTAQDLDRGYASEAENMKTRNVLRKRDMSGAKRGSHADDSKRRSMHSAKTSRTEKELAKMAAGGHSRKSSRKSFIGKSPADEPLEFASSPYNPQQGEITPSKDSPFTPSETGESDTIPSSSKSPTISTTSTGATPKGSVLSRFAPFRAISEAVTGSEKAAVKSANAQRSETPSIGSPKNSNAASGTSSFETDRRSKGRLASTGTAPLPRRKGKKQTSAYLRGLEKKTPAEQMKDCDFSGWMKKKRSVMSPTWNTRLFILKGRRLSYYYSENDTEEKGLIDITGHRVLPATDDPIIGLHAAFSHSTSNPSTPVNSKLETTAAKDALLVAQASPPLPASSTPFIFKMAPPRAGLSSRQTLHFTKPTTHFFAVDDRHQGRLWMAALIKANIELDMNTELKTTYTAGLISLPKAIAMKRRPPNLMGAEDTIDEVASNMESSGLGIEGLPTGGIDGEPGEELARTPRSVLPMSPNGVGIAHGVPPGEQDDDDIIPDTPIDNSASINYEPLVETNIVRNSGTNGVERLFSPNAYTANVQS